MAGSLHSALRAYKDSVEKEYYRPEHERITEWGQTQVRQIETLIEHCKNRPLADLDADGVEELIAHWRRRPLRKNSEEPIKAKSASNYISVLKRFFGWLHKSSRYDWRKPEDFNDISTKVAQLTSDSAKNLQQVRVRLIRSRRLIRSGKRLIESCSSMTKAAQPGKSPLASGR